MGSSSTYTTDFREELEFEQQRWLRRRFLWYAAVIGGFGILGIVAQIAALVITEFLTISSLNVESLWVQLVVNAIAVGVYLWAFLEVRRTTPPRARIVTLVGRVILISGVLSILQTPITIELAGEQKIIEQVTESSRRARELKQAREQEAAQAKAAAQESAVVPDGSDAEPRIVDGPAEPQAADAADAADKAERPRALGLFPEQGKHRRSAVVAAAMVGAGGLASILITHLFACLFLPLTPRESMRPVWPLLILNSVMVLLYAPLVLITFGFVLASPIVVVPGAVICWWRQSRFRSSFTTKLVKKRYGEMKQELTSARQIHESLFPRPIVDGPVRFHYRYAPMRQIGGDYLYARSHSGVLTLVIIDVTGHGIGAALTVNRLHGEISREFGEDPDVGPGELLNGINAYLHHTLADHSVYATALCIRIEADRNQLRYASAGHPPAFVRTVDGRIEQLDSTTLVLGACRGDDFVPAEQTVRFGPGDALIAYTDGAQEARNSKGRMFGVSGLRNAVVSTGGNGHAPGSWCEALLRLVDEHRYGPIQDDTLVVEVTRPL